MESSTVSVLRTHTSSEEYDLRSLGEDRLEFVEPLGNRNHAARGTITGVLLGAGLWAAILVLVGVIKL